MRHILPALAALFLSVAVIVPGDSAGQGDCI
jgi:hypothetical protein